MTDYSIEDFSHELDNYYRQHGRHDLPWRSAQLEVEPGVMDPYAILVSELMLQQTQVARVIQKYQAFMQQFPTITDLAEAEQGTVLAAWSGLGYNRRAKFLHAAACLIANELRGIFPDTMETLVLLPGVGPNTAGAIMAYAFNKPVIFVETNIRTVFIHHFFHDQTDITDKQIKAIMEATINQEDPRQWYWSLMDYGSFLKGSIGNLNKLSVTYSKQSPFHGSRRQIRGQIIKLLTVEKLNQRQLTEQITDERLESVLNDLLAEGLIHKTGSDYHL